MIDVSTLALTNAQNGRLDEIRLMISFYDQAKDAQLRVVVVFNKRGLTGYKHVSEE